MKSNVVVDKCVPKLRPGERPDHALLRELVVLLRRRLRPSALRFTVSLVSSNSAEYERSALALFTVIGDDHGSRYLGGISVTTDSLEVCTYDEYKARVFSLAQDGSLERSVECLCACLR